MEKDVQPIAAVSGKNISWEVASIQECGKSQWVTLPIFIPQLAHLNNYVCCYTVMSIYAYLLLLQDLSMQHFDIVCLL